MIATIDALWPWTLAAVRLFALLRAQALWRTVVGPLWWLVAAALALMLAPIASPGAAVDVGLSWPVLIALELLIGTVLGHLVALPGYALLGTASISNTILGPPGRGGRTVAALVAVVGLALALGLGLHGPLIASASLLFEAWPVAAIPGPSQSFDLASVIAMAAHGMLLLGLTLSTPVLLSALVVDVVAGLVQAGGHPAGAVISGARPWLRTAAALIALGASWAAYPAAWGRALG